MKESISVNQALKKGKIKLVYLPMVILVLMICFGIYLLQINYIDGWFMAVFTVLGFLSA